ncbi:MAG: lipoyl(octanoyl) transferase LipB [Deltaproteobacteria bacterium]|nr:lipoyl(octanoyl) transferase LipB [Deltaproteobacteria bacterium]
MNGLSVKKLGLVPYLRGLELQAQAAKGLRERPGSREVLFVLQHPTVITLGRSASRDDVLLGDEELRKRDIELVLIDRGGNATLHSPGQIVLYPILHLGRRHLGPARLVELLEDAMIETCRAFGVAAGRLPPHPGAWIAEGSGKPARKIGAIGLRVSGGVTTHGIAFNVANDLELYRSIVPCGLLGLGVTSLEAELGRAVDFAAVEDALVWAVRSDLDDTADAPPPSPVRAGAAPSRRGSDD